MKKLTYSRKWNTYNGKRRLENGIIAYGNYNIDTKECYLVFQEGNIHYTIISVLEAYGEIRGELYDGFDYVIAREVLRFGHLTKKTAKRFYDTFGYNFESDIEREV